MLLRRVQRGIVAAQRGHRLASAPASPAAAERVWRRDRMIDAIGGDRSKLVEILSEPFTLYQAGFDASWN